MIPVVLKGKLLQVCDPIEVGENKLKKQIIRVLVNAPVNEFGDKKGSDEVWQLEAIGDNVTRLDLKTNMEEATGSFNVWIVSNTVASKQDRAEMYILNATIVSYSLN